jgi:hypothetical protein
MVVVRPDADFHTLLARTRALVAQGRIRTPRVPLGEAELQTVRLGLAAPRCRQAALRAELPAKDGNPSPLPG